MWKHDNFINLQLYAPPLATSMEITVDGETVLLEVTATDISWERNLEEIGTWFTSPYSIVNNKVIWENGQTLQYGGADVLGTDIMIENGVYTTVNGGGGSMTKQVDLTTLTGWANLSDGEHTITIKAKADGYRDSQASEGVSVTKGSTGETWVLNETLTIYSLIYWLGDVNDVPEYTKIGMFIIDFTSNNETFFGITPMTGEEPLEPVPPGSTYDRERIYLDGTWTNTAYRTLTFATAPTGDLLTWLQANGTKQGGGSKSYPGKF